MEILKFFHGLSISIYFISIIIAGLYIYSENKISDTLNKKFPKGKYFFIKTGITAAFFSIVMAIPIIEFMDTCNPS